MDLLVAVLALLLAIAALLAAGFVWVTLSARIRELELHLGGSSPAVPPLSEHGMSPEGLPPCSPRVRLLAKTLGRKDEAIQVYQNENHVSHEDATAAIEKLMAE